MIPVRDIQMTRTIPYVNWILIVADILVFSFQLSLPEPSLQAFVIKWGVTPGVLTQQAHLPAQIVQQSRGWLTLFTSLFIHVGWVHLIGNMLYLFIFGDNVEDLLGHFRYLIFYFAVGVCASLTHVIFDPKSMVPMVGASGAIAGILGAYLANFPGARVVAMVPVGCFLSVVEVPAVIFLGVWFLTNLLSGVASIGAQAQGGVAWWAHIGGFVSGLVISVLMRRRQSRNSRRYYT